jgi:hypothetical protein
MESFNVIWLTKPDMIKKYLKEGWHICFVIKRPYYTSYLLRKDDE